MELMLKDVRFSYDKGLPTEKAVLRSLELRVKSGELVSVVGRTGSGKTTLGLIMAGLLKPQSGDVLLTQQGSGPPASQCVSPANQSLPPTSRSVPPTVGGGVSLGSGTSQENQSAGRLDVVMVFQVPESQFFEENVFCEVAFGPSRLGIRDEELRDRVFSSLGRLGMDAATFSRRLLTRLSEGEKRKVAIASALACKPLFLILDEPAISLDWQAARQLFNLMRGLADSGVGVTVLTHEVESAVQVSDRLAVLSQGTVVASGRLSAQDVYECWQAGLSATH